MRTFEYIYTAYSKEETTINSEHIIKFLEKLLEYDKERGISKTFIILDNARIHTAETVKTFAREHAENLVLIFQPYYSPELNPQEYVWNWLKKFVTGASAYKTVTGLMEELEKFKAYTVQNKAKVKSLVYARLYYK